MLNYNVQNALAPPAAPALWATRPAPAPGRPLGSSTAACSPVFLLFPLPAQPQHPNLHPFSLLTPSPRSEPGRAAPLVQSCWAGTHHVLPSGHRLAGTLHEFAAWHVFMSGGKWGSLGRCCYVEPLVSKPESTEHYTEPWCAETKTRRGYIIFILNCRCQMNHIYIFLIK